MSNLGEQAVSIFVLLPLEKEVTLLFVSFGGGKDLEYVKSN
jgi:hypothetical protein